MTQEKTINYYQSEGEWLRRFFKGAYHESCEMAKEIGIRRATLPALYQANELPHEFRKAVILYLHKAYKVPMDKVFDPTYFN